MTDEIGCPRDCDRACPLHRRAGRGVSLSGHGVTAGASIGGVAGGFCEGDDGVGEACQ